MRTGLYPRRPLSPGAAAATAREARRHELASLVHNLGVLNKAASAKDAQIAQVVYYDHRGNGRSDPGDPNEWNLDVWADDVVTLSLQYSTQWDSLAHVGQQFDVGIILDAIKERGEVVTKIAYADWTRAGEVVFDAPILYDTDFRVVSAGDLADPTAPRKIWEAAIARLGRIDALVNNAGGQYFVPAEAIAISVRPTKRSICSDRRLAVARVSASQPSTSLRPRSDRPASCSPWT